MAYGQSAAHVSDRPDIHVSAGGVYIQSKCKIQKIPTNISEIFLKWTFSLCRNYAFAPSSGSRIKHKTCYLVTSGLFNIFHHFPSLGFWNGAKWHHAVEWKSRMFLCLVIFKPLMNRFMKLVINQKLFYTNFVLLVGVVPLTGILGPSHECLQFQLFM